VLKSAANTARDNYRARAAGGLGGGGFGLHDLVLVCARAGIGPRLLAPGRPGTRRRGSGGDFLLRLVQL
jgi:hypothetical protein